MTQEISPVKAPAVGEPAPPLILLMPKDATGKPRVFDLHAAIKQGPVIVAFFPGTFTSTCTSEMACFTNDWNQYAALGAQFIGVSVDSVPSQKAFTEKHGYKVPFGSDFEKKAIRDWGVESKFWWGHVSRRATFVVDRNGVVRYADVQQNSDFEPNYTEIQAVLKTLR